MKTTDEIVRTALAHYLDLDPSTIESWHHLELDLHLSRGDVVLVARQVADMEKAVLLLDEIESMATVGDLLARISRAASQEKPVHPMDRVA
jgi:hypothetical protein